MKNKLFPIAPFNKLINKHLNYKFEYDYIYQSSGLENGRLKKFDTNE